MPFVRLAFFVLFTAACGAAELRPADARRDPSNPSAAEAPWSPPSASTTPPAAAPAAAPADPHAGHHHGSAP